MMRVISSCLSIIGNLFFHNIQDDFDAVLKEVPENHFYTTANLRKLLEKYTPAELELIYEDFCEIEEQTSAKASKQLDYVVTAGGPGSGKSTLLEGLIAGGDCSDVSLEKGIVRAYIDPDRTCLLRMENTYKEDLSSGKRSPKKRIRIGARPPIS